MGKDIDQFIIFLSKLYGRCDHPAPGTRTWMVRTIPLRSHHRDRMSSITTEVNLKPTAIICHTTSGTRDAISYRHVGSILIYSFPCTSHFFSIFLHQSSQSQGKTTQTTTNHHQSYLISHSHHKRFSSNHPRCFSQPVQRIALPLCAPPPSSGSWLAPAHTSPNATLSPRSAPPRIPSPPKSRPKPRALTLLTPPLSV